MMHSESPPAAIEAPAIVHTAYGGVMQLVPVVEQLTLTRLPSIGAPWGAWGWIELVARALLPGVSRGRAADPIWPLLAALDQREAWSPLGEPVEPTTARAAQGRLPPASSRRPLPPAAIAIVPDGGLRLAEQAVAVAVEHLTGELACPPDVLTDHLLCRPATIVSTGVTLDVTFAMDDTRSAVHRTGLESDPVWHPAFGRVIRLHGMARDDA